MIREPTPSDSDQIVSILRKMHEETQFSRFPLSEDKLRERVDLFLDPESDFFRVVSEHQGVISGLMFGHTSDLWFSDTVLGFDDLLYVVPEARGRMSAVRMLRKFEEWCREKGCSAVLVGVSSGVMVERTGRLLETLGYGCIGGLYRRHF